MELKIDGLCPLLQVFDMPTSLAFYRDVLGFTVVSRAPDQDNCDWALLKINGSHLMLNTVYEAARARARACDRGTGSARDA